MKIDPTDAYMVRSHRADVISHLIGAGKMREQFAKFAEQLGRHVANPETVELHVFTDPGELSCSNIEHEHLRREIQRNRAFVEEEIAREGFFFAHATRSTPASLAM